MSIQETSYQSRGDMTSFKQLLHYAIVNLLSFSVEEYNWETVAFQKKSCIFSDMRCLSIGFNQIIY